MLEVSRLPPPYSRDRVSLPPPIQGDASHCVWTIQLAFEDAREIVRYAVLTTFRGWLEEWPLKGQSIPREKLMYAYSLAPEGLKRAVDWQLRWDTPALIRTEHIYRSLEYHRKLDSESYEEVLSAERLEREFDVASPNVQHAVATTFLAWNRGKTTLWSKKPRLSRAGLVPAYEVASRPLKAAMSFVLQLGLDWSAGCTEDIDRYKASIQRVGDFQKAEMHRWDVMGKTVGRW